MDIKDVQSNKILLPRKEVKALISFEQAIPTRKQLKKSIADKLKVKEELVIVRHVYSKYGTKDAEVIAYIYDNEEALKSLEYEKMMQKNSDKLPKAEAKAE
jgi:small subunit ribosomal protein S24e